MLTFENFKTVFSKAASRPYWTAYQGSTKGKRIGNNFDQGEAPDIQASLADLVEVVELYGEGVYTVEQKKTPTASQGDVHTFAYGEVTAAVGRAALPAPAQQQPQGFFSGLDAKYFLTQTFHYQGELQKAQMDLLRAQWEMERVKREAQEREADVSTGERIMGFLEKNPRIVDRAFDTLLGQPAASVGRLKSADPIPGGPDAGEEGEEYEKGKIDLNALFDAAYRIQAKMPDQHVNDILDRLAAFVEDNPGQAANLINMLPE
jgi:hypothetical protein